MDANGIQIVDPAEQHDASSNGYSRRWALAEALEEVGQTGCWAWTPCTGELLWSKNLYRIYGVDPGEVVPSPEWVIERIHPEDRSHVAGYVERLGHERRMPPLEYRFVLGDGSTRYLRSRVAFIEEGPGSTETLLGFVQDLTEERLADRVITAHIAVSHAMAVWDGPEAGARRLLRELGTAMGFRAGALWVPCDEVLTMHAFWSEEGIDGSEFETACRAMRIPTGAGLAGRVREAGQPISVRELPEDPVFEQREAARAGLPDAVAIPALDGTEVVAVLEFHDPENHFVLGERMRGSLVGIGHEVGIFLARRRGQLAAPRLTPRELEVLQLAASRHSGPMIAGALSVSPATIKTHFEHIYSKLGVRDRASAVAAGLRQGLVD